MDYPVNKTDLDDFIAESELNWSLYETMLIMEGNIRFPKRLNTLKVFNYTYSILEKLQNDKQPQETITDYLSLLLFDLLGEEEFIHSLVCECLRVILTFSVSENPKYSFCLLKLNRSTNEMYHHYFDTLINNQFEIESVNKEFEEIYEYETNEIHGDFEDRINFYKRVLARFKRRGIRPDIVEKIEKEIELNRSRDTMGMMLVPSVDSNTDEDEDDSATSSKCKRTMKVTTETIMLLLKELKLTQDANNVAIAAFIHYLTGFSEERIRQWLSNPEMLTMAQKKEVDYANEVLSKIKFGKSVKYNS